MRHCRRPSVLHIDDISVFWAAEGPLTLCARDGGSKVGCSAGIHTKDPMLLLLLLLWDVRLLQILPMMYALQLELPDLSIPFPLTRT